MAFPVARPDILGGDELLVSPAPLVPQQVAEPEHVRGPHGDAAATGRMLEVLIVQA
jgi:hypothetical protein